MPPYSSDDVGRSPGHSAAADRTRPARAKMATPFPWLPMLAIVSCLVTVAYTICNLFPYAGYMVQHLGVTDDRDQAGFYSGYLSSAFMLGRSGSSYFWGRVADRYGRMPVMYMGLCSIAVMSVAFGLSTTFMWAFACRLLTGALTGIVANSKTMITEVCGSEHEVIGMSFLAGAWSVGLVIGSGLGGLLAEPAKHYPALFSESGLFGRFPYLLPNILGASLALIGLFLVFFLVETSDIPKGSDRSWRGFESIATLAAELHNPEAAADEGEVGNTSFLDNGYDPQLVSGWRSEATVGSGGPTACETGGNNSGCNGSSVQARANERLPLVQQRLGSSSEAPELEGGGFRSVHGGAGGKARSGGGVIGEGKGVDARGGESRGAGKRMAFLRECLPPMKLFEEKRVRTALFMLVLASLLFIGFDEVFPLWAISSVDSGGVDWTTQEVGQALSACGGGMLVFQLLVYPRIVARVDARTPQRWACCVAIPVFLAYPFLCRLHDDSKGVLMAATVVLLFFTNAGSITMFINMSLAINNAVDPSQRGTINGLSMTLGSLATAAGPIVCSTVFAWSIDRRRPFPFDYHFVFYLFAVGMVFITATSWDVVISPAEANSKDSAASPVVVAKEIAGRVEVEGVSSGTHRA